VASLHEELVIAVAQNYASDPSSASVTMSRVRRGEELVFYGSVVRYLKAYGEEKQVAVKAMAKTHDGCVRVLAEKFLFSGLRTTYPALQKKLAEEIRDQLVHPTNRS
jgi:hypothetical protein